MSYNERNFFDATAAVFDLCDQPEREPDYISGSGSAYWYVNGGVVRRSNHWGDAIASCAWYIRELDMSRSENLADFAILERLGSFEVCAFASFDTFRNVSDFRAEWWQVRKEIGFKVNPLF